ILLSPPWEACLFSCLAVAKKGISICPQRRPRLIRLQISHRPSRPLRLTRPTRIPLTTTFRPSECFHESFPIPKRRTVCRERTGQPDCRPIRQPQLYLFPCGPGATLPGL